MRRLIGFVLSFLLLLPAPQAAAFLYYQPAPRGALGISMPTLGQRLELRPGEAIRSVKAWIDDQPVAATWSEEGEIQFWPERPLSEGSHTARLQILVAAGSEGLLYQPLDTSWQFTILPGAQERLPGPDAEVRRAQTHLNQIRRQLGLGAVATSSALSSAARSHAAYLLHNAGQYGANAHGEEAGRPGFTGTTATERAAYWGWQGGAGEVIAPGGRAEDAIDGWLATLYHRLPLLHPETQQIGYGWAGDEGAGFNVLLTGKGAAEQGEVAWPAPGMEGVPPEWDGLEMPDPLALYGLSGPVGYPVSLTFGGPLSGLRLTEGRITRPGGEVDSLPYDPLIDRNLTDSVALIPKEPLQPGTTYEVTLRGWIDRGDGRKEFERSWSFRTAEWGAPVPLRMQRRGSQVTLSGRSFAPSIRLFVDGVAVAVERLSESELRFTLPGGMGGRPADLLLVNPDGLEGLWSGLDFGGVVSAPSPWRSLELTVNQSTLAEGALLDDAGRLFLPESTLRALGGEASRLEGLDRVDWQWPGRTGEYTRASLKATVDDQTYQLQSPPFLLNGQLWLEAGFVARLSGAPVERSLSVVSVGRPPVPPALSGAFTDTADHWAVAQIRSLAQQGIISGFPDGSFRPEEGLSRAAIIKLIAEAMGLEVQPGVTAAYDDAVGHWVAELGYLGAARAAGVLPDWQGSRLQPDRLITRSEIAVMLARAMRLEIEAQRRARLWEGQSSWQIGEQAFVDAADWSHRGHIAVAIESGIITGYAEPGGSYSFRPERPATRAEAAVMVARFLAR